MNWKRFLIAIAFAFVVATAFDILINAVLLRRDWMVTAQCWRPAAELNRLVPLGWAAMLGVMILQSVIFVRAGWRGLRRGLEFGCWLGLAAFVGVAGGMSSMVAWPPKIIIGMALQQVVNSLVTGLSLGWLYRPTGSAEVTGFS